MIITLRGAHVNCDNNFAEEYMLTRDNNFAEEHMLTYDNNFAEELYLDDVEEEMSAGIKHASNTGARCQWYYDT